MRPHRPDTATGAEVCRLLGLDPDHVSSLGFELNAFGITTVRVELILEDELADRIAVALLSSTADRDANHDREHDRDA